MNQTRLMSAIEAVLNVGSGMVLSFSINQLACYISFYTGWFKWDIGFSENIVMTITLTVVSMARTYAWRRYFNSLFRRNIKV